MREKKPETMNSQSYRTTFFICKIRTMIILHEVTLKLEIMHIKVLTVKFATEPMLSAKAIKNLPFESNRKGSL